MRTLLCFLFSFILSPIVFGQPDQTIRDRQGRQIIPRGFVLNTEDKIGDIYYTPEDFHRMVKMGADFQVIRLKLGRLGGYPGNDLEESYLLHLDSMVNMGKNAGLKTDFKMTVYGSKGFDWGDFWRDKDGQLDRLASAWKMLAERYKNEPAVFGYDLLNEPLKGDLDVSYEVMESDYLIPLIQRLMDIIQSISPDKKLLYQPILVNDPDRKIYNPPFIRMKTPVNRKNIFYAPHIYEADKSKIRNWINQYEKDAAVSGVPIFIGEWGPATYDATDSSLVNQHNFIDFYAETANVFDSLGLGTIKAWFTGTRFVGDSPGGKFTWSIFKDNKGVGTIERKYIVDIIARPYPQCISGDIINYKVDFASRSLTVHLRTDNTNGASKIFIPLDRWYPDGFTVTIGDMVAKLDPDKNVGLEAVKPGKVNLSDLIWDSFRQQLVILRWPENGANLTLMVQPGLYQEILPR